MTSSGAPHCIFCKIVSRTIPATFVFEDDDIVAFQDAHPAAPVHALVIPRKHVAGIEDVSTDDAELLGRVLLAARSVAAKLGLSASGYRLVVNQGATAGQSVFHLHCHVLGGRAFSWPPG
ncbi:MAG: histidine triad nucleotide-binding protein [Polyangiaceae bacterium]|jgi:histidine triad (HIT) family protein